MNRLFLDANIILDLLAERDLYYEEAALIATLADLGQVKIVVSPISFATVNYFLTKFENSKIALEKLRKFKVISEICQINELIVEKALNSDFTDFEDALQYFSALEAKCEFIITRNGKDFKKSSIPVMSAKEYLKSNNK